MRTYNKFSRQKGQAIVELCVCMIPILVILLGMIFIAGLGISNIKTFIQAKGNAEELSRNSITGGEGQSVYSWDYGDTNQGGDGYAFTADDRAIGFNAVGAVSATEVQIDSQLNIIDGSESLAGDDNSNYIFMPVSALPIASDNFSQDICSSMVAAAELVKGSANSNLNKVFTLSPSEFSDDEIQSFNLSFGNLVGINIDDIDLQEMQANTVYYPAMPGSD